MGEQATDVQPKRKRRPRGSGSIYSVPGSRFLWICYYDAASKQRRESSGSEKPTDAQNLLRRRMAEVQNGTFIEPKKRRVTVDELYQDELADLEKRRKQTRWVKPCWERLEKFFGGRQACLIRRADLEAYQTYRLQEYRKEFPDADEKKLSACETLINKDLAVLRMVLYRGHALEKLAAVPPFPPKLQGAMERAGTVTEEQFRVMLADCGNDEVWLKAMLLMSYTWGYRLEELLKMRCIQVSLTDRIVYLPPRSTKNKRPRPIPISDDEIGPLRICVSGKMPEDKVFTRENGKPVKDFRDRWDKLVATSNAGHMEINERGERVWIPAIFHDLRRSASTNLLAGGMSPENVRKVVGHLSEEMTARYNQPAMTALAAQQRKGAALLAAMQSAALPENVIHSSCTVDPQNGEPGKESLQQPVVES